MEPTTHSFQEYRTIAGVIGKFLVSGTIGAGVNLLILYVLTEYVGLHYLLSACVSFLIASSVGFVLQKFWTFTDRSADHVRRQAIGFFIVGAINLGLNIMLLAFFVETMHFWYMFAQVVASFLIAFSSFLLYRYVIFSRRGVL